MLSEGKVTMNIVSAQYPLQLKYHNTLAPQILLLLHRKFKGIVCAKTVNWFKRFAVVLIIFRCYKMFDYIRSIDW